MKKERHTLLTVQVDINETRRTWSLESKHPTSWLAVMLCAMLDFLVEMFAIAYFFGCLLFTAMIITLPFMAVYWLLT